MGTSCFTEQIDEIVRSENFKEICDIEIKKITNDPELKDNLGKFIKGAAMCGKFIGDNYHGNRQ